MNVITSTLVIASCVYSAPLLYSATCFAYSITPTPILVVGGAWYLMRG
ncbi:MAG: hypothetical protein PHG66_06265 [Candidatus Colwellbacteria bacterium]|nr:hypothetical protein [Candidatus Colwellbacteria bacterium]